MSGGWKTATRPHGTLGPFIIEGTTYLHTSRVCEILELPRYNTDPKSLFRTASRENFHLDAIRVGRRWLYPEEQVLALKRTLDARRSSEPFPSVHP
jgi:hypothetical protein